MVGRTKCPECDFESAHVKRSEKCLYRFCPECGSQHYAKSKRQEADLMSKTRQEGAATATGPSATKDDAQPQKIDTTVSATATATGAATVTPDATATVAPRRHGLGLFA